MSSTYYTCILTCHICGNEQESKTLCYEVSNALNLEEDYFPEGWSKTEFGFCCDRHPGPEVNEGFLRSLSKARVAYNKLELFLQELGGESYLMEYLKFPLRCADYLYRKCLPFHPGEIVYLKETPTITREERWGWMGAKHFLVKGAKGTVGWVQLHHDGEMCFYIWFENESCLDLQGREHPLGRHSYYCFGANWLSKEPVEPAKP